MLVEMAIERFEKLHELFLKSYNLDDECRWRPDQKEYKKLKQKVTNWVNEFDFGE